MDHKTPSLEQCMQVAKGSWPTSWDIDPADVPTVMAEAIYDILQAFYDFRMNAINIARSKGKEWDQSGDSNEAIADRISQLPTYHARYQSLHTHRPLP